MGGLMGKDSEPSSGGSDVVEFDARDSEGGGGGGSGGGGGGGPANNGANLPSAADESIDHLI